MVSGRVVRGQDVPGPVAALPLRHRRLAPGPGDEAGALHELELVDVAGQFGKTCVATTRTMHWARSYADSNGSAASIEATPFRRSRFWPSKSMKSRPTFAFAVRFPRETNMPLPS